MTYARYCIAGNFRGRKLLRIARFYRAKGHNNPKFTEKTFRKYPQNHINCKSFLLQEFPAILWYNYNDKSPFNSLVWGSLRLTPNILIAQQKN